MRHSRAELDKLHAEIMDRLDHDFLDWYFGWLTQKSLGFNSLLDDAKSFLGGVDADEKLQRRVAREFGVRVILTPVVEERIERIAHESATRFVASLTDKLQNVLQQHEIPPLQWEEYVDRATVMVSDTEGASSVPMTLRALLTGTTTTGVSVAAASPFVSTQFGKISAIGSPDHPWHLSVPLPREL